MKVLLGVLLLGAACGARGGGELSTAEKIVASDATLRQRIQPSSVSWTADSQGKLVSSAWRERAGARAFTARIPSRGDESLDIGETARSISLSPEGSRPVAPALDAGRAIYRELYPFTDEVIASGSDRVEWFYLLKDARAPRTFSHRVTLPAYLPSVLASSGGLEFRDVAGVARFRMPKPYAIDAHGIRRDAQLDWKEGCIVVSLDTRDLTYPIVLDPSVESAVWTNIISSSMKAAGDQLMVFDSLENRTVLLSGGLTWQFDGTGWNQSCFTAPCNASAPGARSGPAMAYDPDHGVTLVFGGTADGTTALSDLWKWDGNSWTQVSGNMPPARWDATLTYDPIRHVSVLFGGTTGNYNYLSDTWEWNGSTWSSRSPMHSPAGRSAHAAAYSPVGQNGVLVYGGQASNLASAAETWGYNGTDWTLLSSTGPSGRSGAEMTYDGTQVMLFGGFGAGGFCSGGLLSDTWLWNGSAWTNAMVSGPPGRDLYGMAYDAFRGRVVVWGGNSINTSCVAQTLSDTWQWDGVAKAWTSTGFVTSPAARWGQMLAFDSTSGKVLLFGGNSSGFSQETWEWNVGTHTWAQRTPTTNPAGRYFGQMADTGSANLGVVLQGGASPLVLSDLYSWNSAANQWTSIAVTNPLSKARHGLAYDASRLVLVVFGGAPSSGETWELDVTQSTKTWVQVATTGPPTRNYLGMVYAPGQGVLMFGGFDGTTTYNDLWSWNGSVWTQLCTSSACTAARPPGRYSGGVAYDSLRNKLIITGGRTATADLSDTWEWDGTAWKETSPSGISARSFTSMAFDSAHGRVVIEGGRQTSGSLVFLGDTWEYHTRSGDCVSGTTCDSGFCTDGVCCDSNVCDTCKACNTVANPGVCTLVAVGSQDDSCNSAGFSCGPTGSCGKVTGASCSLGSECSSSFCSTDGICCDQKCDGICQVCKQANGATADGTCAPAPLGQSGGCAGHLLCDGSHAGCPASCDSDDACSIGYYCAASGTCALEKVQAASCDSTAGHDCLNDGCRVCASGHCSDGFCCDTACAGSCNACAVTAGAIVDGTCAVAAKGAAGAPACGAYVCDGSSATCPTTCVVQGDCGADAACVSNQCHGQKAAGSNCASHDECMSAHCADGVCCDAACDGVCVSCSLADHKGTCTPIPQGQDPTSDCASDCAGTCSGQGSCQFPVGQACATCAVCGSDGKCDQLPASSDDQACGTIDCSGIMDSCRVYHAATVARCIAPKQCAQPDNSVVCSEYTAVPNGTDCDVDSTCQDGTCIKRIPVKHATGCNYGGDGTGGRDFVFALLLVLLSSVALRRGRKSPHRVCR